MQKGRGRRREEKSERVVFTVSVYTGLSPSINDVLLLSKHLNFTQKLCEKWDFPSFKIVKIQPRRAAEELNLAALGRNSAATILQPREADGTVEMDDLEKTMSTVAQLIEQLHANKSSPHEKEFTTTRLLGIAKARKEARGFICSHGQAMPLFIVILRNGTPLAKVNVAATLSILCKDEDLRLKVLLGGCIPPLLSVLKSDSTEARKAAAEAIFQVSSSGLSDDPIGTKLFVTEGVVRTLWEQLNPKQKQDKTVEGFVTGGFE